jgi:hypothetical protein
MVQTESLGNLSATEKDVMNLIEQVIKSDQQDIVPGMMLTLGVLYQYAPDDFFKRLSKTVLKKAEELGLGDHPLTKILTETMNNLTPVTKENNIGYL